MSFISIIQEVFTKFQCKKVKYKFKTLKKYCPDDLKKSLTLRVIDAWDDESTMIELYSLEWPYYSLWAYWINFTASPKHSDGLVIVWAITKNMEQSVKNAFDVISSPKIIIACGDKAIHWDKKFDEISWWVQDVLWIKPDLEIPWNPPSSKDIFDYLVSFVKWK